MSFYRDGSLHMRKFLSYLLVVVVALAVVVVLDRAQFMRDLESMTIDLRELAFAPTTGASDHIVMVWLDEETMAELPYRSPVPRDFLAKLNDRIAAAGPAATGYDIYFKDPSFPPADQALATSLARTNTYAVMPLRTKDYTLSLDGRGQGEGDRNSTLPRPLPSREGRIIAEGFIDPPMELFRKALRGVGLADLPVGAFDTKVRTARLAYRTDAGDVPTFAGLLYHAATGANASDAVNAAWHWPTLGPLRFTPFFMKEGELLIRFAGPPSTIGAEAPTFKVFPARLVVSGIIPPEWFRDKIVLVGAAYADLMDAFLTPYYARATNFARMNGVEVHANILNMLLNGQFYYGLGRVQRWALIGIVAFLSAAFALYLAPLRSALVSVVLMSALAAGSIYSFTKAGIVIPLVAPLIAALAAYGGAIIVRALTEGRKRRIITQTFAKYVPGPVVAMLARNPELARLGGDERVVTSLFSDIASFTTLSEKLPPTDVMRFLNDYLARMNEAIIGAGGTIDKYEGDAVVAFFNAPLDVELHETRALTAACAMQKASRDVSQKWRALFGRDVVTRVGINTGRAIVGNLGSEGRFDYTAIGDTINLASRLEGANKFYGTRILASEATIAHVSNALIVRPADRVRVVGRADPVVLYEVVGMRDDVDAKLVAELVRPYDEAYRRFMERKFSDARDMCAALATRFPEDTLVTLLGTRCARALKEPAWDLITALIEK